MEKGLQEKTGKPLKHWVKVLEKARLEKHREMIEYLKAEHDFSYGFANFVAHKYRKSDAASHDGNELIEQQYGNGKEPLKAIYLRLIEVVSAFGSDVEIAPKKSSVSLRRKTQFAIIKPATKTRVDIGLKLRGEQPTERLENSGPFGTMCTHRVRVTDEADVDAELVDWLREAYRAAG